MYDPNMEVFSKRLRRIDRRHQKMARGYVTVVNSDGLVVARPRRTQLRFPWKMLAVAALALFVFKGFVYANLGQASYSERVTLLQAGTPAEQFGAWVMQADPLTLWIAQQIDARF